MLSCSLLTVSGALILHIFSIDSYLHGRLPSLYDSRKIWFTFNDLTNLDLDQTSTPQWIFSSYMITLLTYRPALWTFWLALQGYSVASILRATHSHSWSLCSLGFVFCTRIFGCFAPSGFALWASILLALLAHTCFKLTKVFEKKKSTGNALKSIFKCVLSILTFWVLGCIFF